MAEILNDDDRSGEANGSGIRSGVGQQLVWKGKVIYNIPPNPILDASVVSLRWYRCFGSNLFPNKSADLQLLAGITSPFPGDGKTLVAANLGTFLALDTQDDTVLVDLNFRRPRLHQVFGVPLTPGIMDVVPGDSITVSRSAVNGLWILPLGTPSTDVLSFEKTLVLRDALVGLKHHFRFVVVDLPPALEESFPVMVANHLDGHFVVISTGKTKTTDIDRTVHILNDKKVIGFVMNRVPEGFLP